MAPRSREEMRSAFEKVSARWDFRKQGPLRVHVPPALTIAQGYQEAMERDWNFPTAHDIMTVHMEVEFRHDAKVVRLIGQMDGEAERMELVREIVDGR